MLDKTGELRARDRGLPRLDGIEDGERPETLGLSREAAFEVLGKTALADQAERRRAAVESGEYPPRFALYLARKDADLILEAAEKAGIELRLTKGAREWLVDAEAAGLGDADYSAVLARILEGVKPASQEDSSDR